MLLRLRIEHTQQSITRSSQATPHLEGMAQAVWSALQIDLCRVQGTLSTLKFSKMFHSIAPGIGCRKQHQHWSHLLEWHLKALLGNCSIETVEGTMTGMTGQLLLVSRVAAVLDWRQVRQRPGSRVCLQICLSSTCISQLFI